MAVAATAVEVAMVSATNTECIIDRKEKSGVDLTPE